MSLLFPTPINSTESNLPIAQPATLGHPKRYGFLLPMDEALVHCAIDFSDRACFIYEGKFEREYVGDFPTEMFQHWMKSFSEHAGMNLNLKIING